MPNRILREGINDSRAVNSLSDSGEIFFRRLMSVVDDFGRFEADIEILRGELFKRALDRWPLTRVSDALAEVSNVRTAEGLPLVLVYGIGVRTYLQISNFNQRLRAKVSKYPEPVPLTSVSTPPSYDGHMSAECGTCPPSRKSETETESYAESQSQPAMTIPQNLCQSEYPETLSEIRSHDPAVDPFFVLKLVQKISQDCISSPQFDDSKLVKLTDKVIAAACKESYKTGPPTHRAGLLLNRVPNIIISWSQEIPTNGRSR